MALPDNSSPQKQSIPRKRKTPSPQSQNSQHRQAMTDAAAPLYITIGPQCCGKSTLLKSLDNGKVKDICLDDQPDVYVPVPIDTFLNCFAKKTITNKTSLELVGQVYQGKTIQNRIQTDNTELGLILQRWRGDISPEKFQGSIQEFYATRKFPLEVAQLLVTAVEIFLNEQNGDDKSTTVPDTIDVFVLESLFRPHPTTNKSAIQKAHDELRTTPKHVPIAWGNTNSKSRDYSQALEIACQTRRPVRFILCHPAVQDEQAAANANTHFLPWVEVPDLLTRNLKRLKSTGRYVPAFAIADCCKRVESLVTVDKTQGLEIVEKKLVSLASPSFMNGNHNQNQQRSQPFKYVLTGQNLIQKIYPQSNQGPRNGHGRHQRGGRRRF